MSIWFDRKVPLGLLWLSVLLFLAAGTLSAQSVTELFPVTLTEKEMTRLNEGDFVHFNSEKGDTPRFVPRHELSRYPEAFRTGEKPGMFLENLVLIPWSGDRQGLLLRLYNELGAVSDQEGLEYISYNRGNKPYPLITRSHYVKSLKEKGKVLKDPLFDQIPAEDIRTVYQKDSTFGGNYYRYIYRSASGAISLDITNLTGMSVLSVFPVAKPEEILIHFFIMPVDEGVLCYTIAYITDPPDQKKVLGYTVNVIGSFEKRIRVVLGWYKKRLGIL